MTGSDFVGGLAVGVRVDVVGWSGGDPDGTEVVGRYVREDDGAIVGVSDLRVFRGRSVVSAVVA